jgi:small subunit ribosomal protein S4e
MQRLVKVDGKVRTDATYPAGLMDVVSIDKTDEAFRLVYDTKGRFVCHRVGREEAAYKLLKVKRQQTGKGGVPYVTTHDGRTLRYPDPDAKVHDTLVFDIESGKATSILKFDVGTLAMVVGGRNRGRVGTVVHREKHKGSFDIVQVRDAAGNEFATRLTNVFVIGKGDKAMISLPKGKGVRLTILEEAAKKAA